jgi:hypothetical protein
MLGPEIKMVGSRDGPRRTLALSHGEKLRKGTRSRDGWLVVTSVGADLVGATVRLECTKDLGAAARVVIAVVLDDIVFSLRRVDPTINREVGARIGSIVVCGVSNGAL